MGVSLDGPLQGSESSHIGHLWLQCGGPSSSPMVWPAVLSAALKGHFCSNRNPDSEGPKLQGQSPVAPSAAQECCGPLSVQLSSGAALVHAGPHGLRCCSIHRNSHIQRQWVPLPGASSVSWEPFPASPSVPSHGLRSPSSPWPSPEPRPGGSCLEAQGVAGPSREKNA